MTDLLTVEGLRHSFGGLRAVDDIDLAVRQGEIMGVIGPNGAGKTTFFNLLTGLIRPNAGRVKLDGQELTQLSPDRIAVLGMARTYQTIRLFDTMTVLANVMVGAHSRFPYSVADMILRTGRFRAGEKALRERAHAVLASVGLTHRADDVAGTLAYGEQRRLELARALATQPRILLLDEPAAGMNGKEASDLAALLRTLVAGGVTILLIEHNVRMVMNLCDRIAVMNFGRKIAEGSPLEVRRNPEVIEAYLGKGA